MRLYARLLGIMPRSIAITLTAFWFAVLIFAALFGAFEPQASFIYGNV